VLGLIVYSYTYSDFCFVFRDSLSQDVSDREELIPVIRDDGHPKQEYSNFSHTQDYNNYSFPKKEFSNFRALTMSNLGQGE